MSSIDLTVTSGIEHLRRREKFPSWSLNSATGRNSSVDGERAGAGVLGVPDEVVLDARLPLDRREPAADVRIGGEIEPRVRRGVRVAVDRKIGERVAAADEEGVAGEVLVEQLEHAARAREPALELRLAAVAATGEDPEAGAADRRDDGGLLEEEPAPNLRASFEAVRQQRRPVGEVEQDR